LAGGVILRDCDVANISEERVDRDELTAHPDLLDAEDMALLAVIGTSGRVVTAEDQAGIAAMCRRVRDHAEAGPERALGGLTGMAGSQVAEAS
jgi:hypothetical protein